MAPYDQGALVNAVTLWLPLKTSPVPARPAIGDQRIQHWLCRAAP